MKNSEHYLILFCSCLLIIMLAGCTLDVGSSSDNPITKNDLRAATQIIGGTLSSDESGVVLSIADALHIISQNKYKSLQGDNSAGRRGRQEGYRHQYDEGTGAHTVSFIRFYGNPFFTKRETDTLRYRYLNEEGNPLEFPTKRSDSIASILYRGTKLVRIKTMNGKSFFTSHDTLLVTGIHRPASDLSIEGNHNETGYRTIKKSDSTYINQSYKLNVSLLNVTAPQKALDYGKGTFILLKGTMRFQVQLDQSGNTNNNREVKGTIRLNGDGTALLSINGRPEQVQINLKNGNVSNINKKFAGRIASVNGTHRFRLEGGLDVVLGPGTSLSDSYFNDLSAVMDSLNKGARVYARGKGKLDGGRFTASSLEVVPEQVFVNQKPLVSFTAQVTSVNAKTRTFVLENKARILINDNTNIIMDGNFITFEEAAFAVKEGKKIFAKGKAREMPTFRSDAVALQVIFLPANFFN